MSGGRWSDIPKKYVMNNGFKCHLRFVDYHAQLYQEQQSLNLLVEVVLTRVINGK